MLNFLKMLATPEFFFSIIRISAPILFATLGAIVVGKAGFCNMGLEGLLLRKQLAVGPARGARRGHGSGADDGLLRL